MFDDAAYKALRYGHSLSGQPLVMPAGWVLVPEGERVPHVHREFTVNPTSAGWTETWCSPRRCRTTMTPIFASLWGHVTAFAAPASEVNHSQLTSENAK